MPSEQSQIHMTTLANGMKWHSQYPELGTDPVPIEPYISPKFFELERERVFRRAWLCLGREERLPHPGDFFVKDLAIARTSILVVRGKDGQIRAFHNACSHRSNKVEWRAKGGASTLTCPFHGWCYGLDGHLLAIPDEQNFFRLDKNKLGLTPIALETWANEQRTFGPTTAAKILYALRPYALLPWDEATRGGLNLDASENSYYRLLTQAQNELNDLKNDSKRFGIDLQDIPVTVGRPESSLPKLVDEYYWVTITRKCTPPDLSTLQSWVRWAMP